jgi:hypothetical protein
MFLLRKEGVVMKGKLENEGNYELFRTTKGHQILNLNDKSFFAVIEGQKGDMLIATDSDHEKDKTIKKGKFYLADFDDDPEFNDLPHLFLQEGNKYREWILPNDKPSQKDYQKKLVKTSNLVNKSKVDEHIKGNSNKGKDEGQRKDPDLSSKSKNELMAIARDKNLRGRSKMSKKELIRSINS